MGWGCARQPPFHQRCVLDSSYGRAVARLTCLVWGLEEHPSALLPLAGSGHVGVVTGEVHCRSGLRMAHDRRQSLQSSSPCGGCARRQPGHESHQRGLNTKVHVAVDAHGMPLRVVVTEGTRADCTQVERLTQDICADYLIADKGYDTDSVIEDATACGIEPVITMNFKSSIFP